MRSGVHRDTAFLRGYRIDLKPWHAACTSLTGSRTVVQYPKQT